MPPVRAKGTTLIATVRYIKDRHGPAGLEHCLAGMPEAFLAQARNGFLASSWYPFSDLVALMRAARRELGAADPRILWNVGRASADFGLNTVYKVFMKVGSPEFIVNKAMTVFPNYYDQGKFTVIESNKRLAIGQLAEFPEPAPELCERIQGFFDRMLELSGATKIELTHPECMARGGKVCRYEGRWLI